MFISLFIFEMTRKLLVNIEAFKNIKSIFFIALITWFASEWSDAELITGFLFIFHVQRKFIRDTVDELLIIFQKHQCRVQQTIYIMQLETEKRRNNCGAISYLESNISYMFLSYYLAYYLSLYISSIINSTTSQNSLDNTLCLKLGTP